MSGPTLLDLQRRPEVAPCELDMLVDWGPRARTDVDTTVVSLPRRIVLVGKMRGRRG